MSVVIPHKNSQYFHPDAKHLMMTIFPFHHWTLDFSHPLSHSLRHCRHQPVLTKLRNGQRMLLRLSTFFSSTRRGASVA